MDASANEAGPRLKVGSVPYLVGRPLDLGLAAEPGIDYVQRVPAELVAGLRAGQLDVALVSSIELFRQPGYRYLADLAVAGTGFVASVQVFLRRPIDEVHSLALDPASRTAATLVRVLLAERRAPAEPRASAQRSAPRFVEVAGGGDPRQSDADAWLAIGDRALRAYLAPDAPPVFNPSQEWCARTGLPFIFAVWIVRPGIHLAPAHLAAFVRARERGRARVPELADEASRRWELPLAACRKYLGEECRYEPGPDMERALFAFRDRAAALELCQSDLSPAAIATRAEHVA
jgi:chorismate dehydratase